MIFDEIQAGKKPNKGKRGMSKQAGLFGSGGRQACFKNSARI